jgi:hypothetical protein
MIAKALRRLATKLSRRAPTFAGTPTTTALSGTSVPSIKTAPAPITQFAPMRQPFMTVALMPIMQFSPIVAP